MRAAAITLLLLATASGCVLSLSEPESDCGDPCPAGFACVAGECVRAATDPDAGAPPDAAPAEEISAPDAAAPVAIQSCDEQFGAALGYALCAEEPTSCEFFAQTGGSTCADLCALHDSECLTAFDSSPEAPCTRQTEDGCLAPHSTQTCICQRPSTGVVGAAR